MTPLPRPRFSALLIAIAFNALHANVSRAAWPTPYFFDDFEDGSAEDGKPVTWSPGEPVQLHINGRREVVDGDYVLTPPREFQPGGEVRSTCAWPQLLLTDASIRMQAKGMEPGRNWISTWARGIFLSDDKTEAASLDAAIRSDGFTSLHVTTTSPDVGFQVLGQVGSATNPNEQMVNIQYDVFGPVARVFVWPNDEPRPIEPVIEGEIPRSLLGEGDFGVCAASFDSGDGPPLRISYFAALPTPYATLVRGDFDENFSVDVRDIDLLSSAIRSASTDLKFDINLDSKIDAADRTFWIQDEKRTYFGDANLDGEFNSADFVQVFQAGQYEDIVPGNSTWSTGDWDGDGDFSSADFVVAFQASGYEKGPRTTVRAVPEPSNLFMLGVFGLIGLTRTARRRG
jgi:hypothetical protein